MDALSYLSVMVSVLLGLGLTQLFAGIGNLVQVRRVHGAVTVVIAVFFVIAISMTRYRLADLSVPEN